MSVKVPSTIKSRAGRAMQTIAITAAAVTLMSAAASAYSSKVENSCRGDYFKYCPAYKEGSPQLRNCMSQAGRRGGLDPSCLNALVDAGMVPRKYRKR